MLHIQKYHIKPVYIVCKSRIAFYFHTVEKLSGITSPAVVGRKHPQCHGLAKTSRPADTDKFLFCIQILIRIGDQPGLIYINLRMDRFRKTVISRIQINSHTTLPPQPISSALILLQYRYIILLFYHGNTHTSTKTTLKGVIP